MRAVEKGVDIMYIRVQLTGVSGQIDSRRKVS